VRGENGTLGTFSSACRFACGAPRAGKCSRTAYGSARHISRRVAMSAFRTSSVLRMAARVPGIKFPTRRLPDGTRVSDLPAGTTGRDARCKYRQGSARAQNQQRPVR
jgi:hypothetical protein